MKRDTDGVCLRCARVNRVPTDKLGTGARYGHCSSTRFTGQPIFSGANNFNTPIGRNDLSVVVDVGPDDGNLGR
jgi:thioredoxin 2